jgi:epoxyqueuosine reductase
MEPSAMLERARAVAGSNGLVGFGVSTVAPFSEVRVEMERRLDSGQAGRPRFTYSDPVIATDVASSFAWAERLMVGAVTYLPAAGGPGPPRPNTGRIARFATEDHYRPLRAALFAVADELMAAGFRAEVLVDDNRLVDRAAAVRAGVAWWGRSTMALAPRFGPWLLLGSVVTDAPLPVSAPMVRDCGTCTACIPACPTGALDAEGVLDATKCISYWAQTPGPVPDQVREAWGDRFYGCDDCLDACPPGRRWESEAGEWRGRIDLLEVLSASDEDLLSRFGHFYIPRRDPSFLRRNALIALGQSGDEQAVPIIGDQLESSVPMLRAQAAWALGRIGTGEAQASLANAMEDEPNAQVRNEVVSALKRAGHD